MFPSNIGSTDFFHKDKTLSGIKTSTLRLNSTISDNEKVFYILTAAAFSAYFIVFLLINQNGYGDNSDNYGMLRSWQEMVANGIYVPSRFQGNIPSEIILGSVAAILGPTGSNVFSFVLSLIAVSLLFYFFTEICTDRAKIALALMTVAFNPFWMNAASTSMDYLHPIAFFLLGLLCFEKNLPVAAALILSIASGCRISYAPLGLGALGLYAVFSREKEGRAIALQAVCVFLFVLSLIYLPVFISSHLSLSFLTSARPTWQGTIGLLARGLYKSIYLYGLLGTLVIVSLGARSLQDPFWKASGAVSSRVDIFSKICLFVIVYHIALFFYIPARIEYLLPVLIAVAGLCLTQDAPKFLLMTLIAAEVLYWFVSIDILRIDHKYADPCAAVQAVGARIEPHLVAGVLLPRLLHETNELRCLPKLLIETPADIHDRLPRPVPDKKGS